MPATAITIGIGTERSGDASAYFTKYNSLPPNNVIVGTTTTPQGPATLETLLTAMNGSTATEFVVVVHGFSDGSGLFLKLANRNGTAVGADATHPRLQMLMSIAARPQPRTITDTDRGDLQLNTNEINRLLTLMATVRGKSITTIEFRGCNLGRNQQSLGRFREFFGAGRFGAPNLHSFFGRNPVGASQHQLDTHRNTHNGTTYTFTTNFTGPTGVCHVCIGVNSEDKPANGHVVADSLATVNRWIGENLQANATHTGDTLPVHGLWEFPQIDLNNPDPLAGLDAHPWPIWPLAANNGYRNHIIYATGPTVASPTTPTSP